MDRVVEITNVQVGGDHLWFEAITENGDTVTGMIMNELVLDLLTNELE